MLLLKNILLISTVLLTNTEARECGAELCISLCCPKDQLMGDLEVDKCDSAPGGGKGCIAGDPQQVCSTLSQLLSGGNVSMSLS